MEIDKMKLIECINECKPYEMSDDDMEDYIIDSICELREALEKKFNIKIWFGDWSWDREE